MFRIPFSSTFGRIYSIKVMARHRLWSMFYGRSLYIAACGLLLILAIMANDFIAFIVSAGIAVSKEPLQFPLIIALVATAIYFSLWTTIGISREREQGTLMVLLFGPIDILAYFCSWLIAALIGYLFFCLLLGLGLLAITQISEVEFSKTSVLMLTTSFVATIGIAGFGILMASLGGDVRRTIFFFLGFTLILAGIEAANAFFASMGAEQLSLPMIPLSRTIAVVNSILTWISPYGYLPRTMNAIAAQDWKNYIIGSVGALLYGIALTLLAKINFARTGVRP